MLKFNRKGTLDELVAIRATPGIIEIAQESEYGSVILRLQPQDIDELVLRLTTARDAALLMAGEKK